MSYMRISLKTDKFKKNHVRCKSLPAQFKTARMAMETTDRLKLRMKMSYITLGAVYKSIWA